MIAAAIKNTRRENILRLAILLVTAVGGLYLVKWNPYFHRGFAVATTHSLGTSILSGKQVAPPAASVAAALDYGSHYFLAIWQALVVGLLLAATIETIIPDDWVIRLLGSSGVRSSILGGVLGLPGMM